MTGPDCSEVASRALLSERCRAAYYPSIKECVTSDLTCMNNCNKRGACVSGFCHCKPGFFGADCSLSLDPATGKPVIMAGTGWTTRQKRPWVYIYELPPPLLSWQNTKRLDRSTHLHFYHRLLGTGARVADGDLADWYYIPIRQRLTADSTFLEDAIEYVRNTYPWWNRTMGHRHMIINTGDLGQEEVRIDLRKAADNVTFLTHWGLTADKVISGWHTAHRPQKDVVIPVFMTPGHFKHFNLERTPMHWAMPKPTRNTTFFFAGRICGDRGSPKQGVWPNCGPKSPGYSAGVRQYVHYHHWNRTGFRVVTHDHNYGMMLATSKFCLAPLGGGHGQRQIIVSFLGCIPVCIADNVYEPFEPQTNWTEFAVRPSEADIPRLHEILEAIGPDELLRKQRALRCAAQHMVYSSIVGGLFGEDGRFDAFETTLEVLRVMRQHPDAPPESYRAIDKDFDAFMDCRDPPGFKAGGPAPDLLRMEELERMRLLTPSPPRPDRRRKFDNQASPPPPPLASSGKASGWSSFTAWAKSKLTGSGAAATTPALPPPSPSPSPTPQDAGSNSNNNNNKKRRRRGKPQPSPSPQGWYNPLCSHSVMDRKGIHCERYVHGASKTHLLPGGMMCAGRAYNLALCPRIWL
ncbi:hypothetical protein HYH03_017900 [Edaphochlamys debaryana]|uniref:EGF-like domain-containing protein n=1 Tax=Edaphochlamys debaryana TaxID=47281 RepID=A0A835XFR9_9CHLO|nr:hypothetical protein HYH03_017900 [Edaphochlamys debaryana]|eukprot:KAG2483243.1 hypothetical protein HYH03_017900 [Edaphochlamys debaryana]